ncbi:MAG: hypothetical protein AAGB12_11670 [Pseudomonadota bacterium]
MTKSFFLSLFFLSLLIPSFSSVEAGGFYGERRQAVNTFFESAAEIFANGSESAQNNLQALLSDDFKRYIKPSSLNQPAIDWETWRSDMVRFSQTLFDTFEIDIERMTWGKNRVILEASSSADLIGGGTYGQEYVFILEFNSEGKIFSFTEYVDSLYSACFFGLIDCN